MLPPVDHGVAATPRAMTAISTTIVRAMLIHAIIFAALTMPSPVIQPFEASISLLAELATTSAAIDKMRGQRTNEPIASTRDTTA